MQGTKTKNKNIMRVKMKTVISLIISALLLTACFGGKLRPERAMTNYRYATVITVEESYQKVYREIFDYQKREFSCNLLLTGSMDVEGQLYHDIQEGYIVVVSVGLAKFYGTYTEIKAVSDNLTRVTFYYSTSYQKKNNVDSTIAYIQEIA